MLATKHFTRTAPLSNSEPEPKIERPRVTQSNVYIKIRMRANKPAEEQPFIRLASDRARMMAGR